MNHRPTPRHLNVLQAALLGSALGACLWAGVILAALAVTR
jgi:hypothetical protein